VQINLLRIMNAPFAVALKCDAAKEHIIIMIDSNVPTLKRGALPLYHQLKASILKDIEAGRWHPGDQIPTEDALAARFHVSKITVRQALRDLAQLGVIRREQGRGTFLQGAALEEGPRELKSFTAEMRGHGMAARSQVLEQGIIAAPPDVAERLQLQTGASVFRLHRLRLADAQPMGLQTAFVPGALAPGIEEIDFTDASLYEVLASRYSLQAASARETHQAVLIPDDIAALLQMPPGAPALRAERLALLADERPLEWVQSIMRGDRYKVVLDLTRQTHPAW
jgi:GntR family transcriptional regulator